MSNDNYPAGVTDAHEHFNPSETYIEVECTTEEALVIPSFTVKAALNELGDYLDTAIKHRPNDQPILSTIRAKVHAIYVTFDDMEQEREYECSWKGEMELPVSEEAEWDCPQCGNTHTKDTTPDERDPDEDRDDRYDD